MKNPYWKYVNFNPWKKTIDDCAIRAISAGTGLDYREVCRRLGFSFKYGYGLIRQSGTDLRDIKNKFSEYFDIVQDYGEENDVPEELLNDPKFIKTQKLDFEFGIDTDRSGITLNEFIDLFKNTGLYLVSLVGNPYAKNALIHDKNAGHIVFVNTQESSKMHGFFDIWDSGEMIVDAYMRIKKQEPLDSPLHYKYDPETRSFIANPPKKGSLRQLHEMNEKAKRLVELMKQGIVEFIFMKKSTGTRRKAHGTLKRDLIPPEAQRKRGRPKKRPEDLVIYYDTDKKAIRSFKDYLLKTVNKNVKRKEEDVEDKKETETSKKDKSHGNLKKKNIKNEKT